MVNPRLLARVLYGLLMAGAGAAAIASVVAEFGWETALTAAAGGVLLQLGGDIVAGGRRA